MARLKIAIKRPYPTVLVGRIVEQDESLRKPTPIYKRRGDYVVESSVTPAIWPNVLYIRGNYPQGDSITMACVFPTAADADAWLENIGAIVREINGTASDGDEIILE